MELPDDVLAIIRQYSRPLFTHVKEYKQALRVLNMSEWPLLKQHLSRPNAEKVVSVLKTYLAAFVARQGAYAAYEQYNTIPYAEQEPVEYYRLKSIAAASQHHLECMYRYFMLRTLCADLVYQTQVMQSYGLST